VGVEPTSPAWKTGTFAARPRAPVVKRKERESNSQGLSLDRFRGGCRRQSACPSVCYKAPAEGLEPSLVSLTGSRLTIGPHRIIHQQVRMAGFEPAVSCARGTRIAKLSQTLKTKSAQRESNSHFLHGKQMGYHYTMGAFASQPNCQRSFRKRAPSRN
jgi:hypothetical protein